MIQELETVVLKRDISEHRLKSGDIGAVVLCHEDKIHFEVEFVAADGKTIAILTLSEKDIRPTAGAEILHVRPIAS